MKRHLLVPGKRLIFLGVLAVMFVVPAVAQAQGDPCTTPQPTAGSVVTGAPITLQVCAPKLDQNGNPVTTIQAFALYINATRSLPAFVSGATTTSGFTLWTLASVAPAAAGVATYAVAAIDSKGREGLKSDPFVLTVSLPDAAPGKPINLTVK